MKSRNLIILCAFPLIVSANNFVSIIPSDANKYLTSDKREEITYTEWQDISIPICNTDILESEVYYGKISEQSKSCIHDQKRTKTIKTIYSDGREENISTDEFRVHKKITKREITGTHLETTCNNILTNNYSTGDGEYAININNLPVNVYCEMTRDNGGWTLVRRINNDWNSFSDNLAGNTQVGIYEAKPLSLNTYGMVFNNLSFNEFLFTTGDERKWLITDKNSVYGGWSSVQSCAIQGNIFKSSTNPTGPSQIVGWCKRTVQPEDPWISIESHGYAGNSGGNDSFTHSMLYGERNATSSINIWDYYLKEMKGISVYIR